MLIQIHVLSSIPANFGFWNIYLYAIPQFQRITLISILVSREKTKLRISFASFSSPSFTAYYLEVTDVQNKELAKTVQTHSIFCNITNSKL